jgi:16S rRNA (adenine1518-N6/adenine1519-N6)-dimethyltransferase
MASDRLPQGLPPVRKRFGQHFLKDKGVIGRIVSRVVPQEGEVALEVGPGRGALTGKLLENLERLVVVEVDRALAAHLRRSMETPALRVIEDDILRLDLEQVRREEKAERLLLVGNLPYNISAPLLFRLLEQRRQLSRAVIMLQREVAQRLTAGPETKAYSTLSVFLGRWADISTVVQVSNRAFRPVPKVQSTVIEMVFRSKPRVEVRDEALFTRLVRAAFAQRRKMLRNALGVLGEDGGTAVGAAAAKVGIDLQRRAETLSIEEYGAFSDALVDEGVE